MMVCLHVFRLFLLDKMIAREDQREENNLPVLHENQQQGRMLIIDEAKSARDINGGGMLFDITTVDSFINTLVSGIQAPVKFAKKSTIGGDDRVSVIVVVSLDPKNEWKNGILENSRYFKMIIDNDGKMKVISGYGIGKFRQSLARDVHMAVQRINQYIGNPETDARIANEIRLISEILAGNRYTYRDRDRDEECGNCEWRGNTSEMDHDEKKTYSKLSGMWFTHNNELSS